MKSYGLAVAFVAFSLFLCGCGQETVCLFSSADFAYTELGSRLGAAEKELADSAIRFERKEGTVHIDAGFETATLWERPYLTRSRRMQALRKFIAVAKDVLKTYEANEVAELAAKIKVAQATLLNEQEVRRSEMASHSAPLEGAEVTEKFLDDVTSLAMAQDRLATAGLTLRKHPASPVVNVFGSAAEKDVRAFQGELKGFLGKYRHELASPLLAEMAKALENHLKPTTKR